MSILSDKEIRRRIKDGELVVSEFDPYQIQPNSFDLTLGNTWKTILANDIYIHNDLPVPIIHPKKPMKYVEGTFECTSIDDVIEEIFLLMPNEFILLATKEELYIPPGVVGFVQGRSSIARMAIQTENAGLIDAGFQGTVTLEVMNQSEHPILLFAGMRIAHIHFERADVPEVPYGPDRGSKYSGQIVATESRIHEDYDITKPNKTANWINASLSEHVNDQLWQCSNCGFEYEPSYDPDTYSFNVHKNCPECRSIMMSFPNPHEAVIDKIYDILRDINHPLKDEYLSVRKNKKTDMSFDEYKNLNPTARAKIRQCPI